jgi:hypothetical protein
VPAKTRRIPAIGVMAEASLAELQESPPHSQIARDSMSEIMSMLKPHGLTPQLSVPDTVPREELGALLQIIAHVGWLVTLLVPLFVSFNDMLNFVVCIRCS